MTAEALSELRETAPARTAWRRRLRIPGHLAVWAGLYVAGCVVAYEQLAGLSGHPAWTTLGVAFAAGQAIYLLDRVKLGDALLDPADEAADRERYAFLAGHARPVRAFMVIVFLVAAGLSMFVHPLLPPLLVVGAFGVVCYAGRPAPAVSGRKRPKDVLMLKNLLIGGSLAGFAVAISLLDRGDGHGAALRIAEHQPVHLLAAAVIVGLIVFADSIACDVEDAEADRAFGTDSLPARCGRKAGWIAAAAVTVLASGLAFVLAPFPRDVIWPVLLTPSLLIVGVGFPRRPRDPIDLRLPLIALLAMLLR